SVWWSLLAGVGVFLLFNLLMVLRHAGRDQFRWCGFWTMLGLICLHLFGVFDVVSFCFLHWWVLASLLAIYLLLSYPYVRYIEWRSTLPLLYEKRRRDEQREQTWFLREEKTRWYEKQPNGMNILREEDRNDPDLTSRRGLRSQWQEYSKS